ncbi:MAG: hypothetical protein QM764_20765 [Chitinophagaceae bacterium]
MKLKIRTITDHGHDSERIAIDVEQDTNLNEYILLDTTYKNGQLSNKDRHPYLFPDQKVKKGDVVVLLTKKGINTTESKANGSVIYFFYWGLDSNVWNNDGDSASLLHIDERQSHRVTIVKK